MFVGYSLRDSEDAQAQIAKPAQTTSTTTSTTTTTTAPPVLNQPAPASLPLLGSGVSLGSGSNSPNVALYEQRLKDLKFDPGTIDNVYDGKTLFAVQSLQKLKGLDPNGRISDTEINLMNTFQYDIPKYLNAEAKRFEVNLDYQVGILFENSQVSLITTVSTGTQTAYSYVSKKTGRRMSSVANTPTGRFEFTRRYSGWEPSDLGRLYNPVYFKGGIAVHGYPSVPTKPASHGCVRIPMYVAEYFPSLVKQGEAIYVYGSKEVAYYADRVGPVVTAAPTTTTTIPETTTTVTVPESTPEPTPEPPPTP